MDEDQVWDLNAPVEVQRKRTRKRVRSRSFWLRPPTDQSRFPLRNRFMLGLWAFGFAILAWYAFSDPSGGQRLVGPGLAILIPHAFFVWVVLCWPWSWYVHWGEYELYNADAFSIGLGLRGLARFPRCDGFALLGGLLALFSCHFWFLFFAKLPSTYLGLAPEAESRLVEGAHPDPWGFKLLLGTSEARGMLLYLPVIVMLIIIWRVWFGKRSLGTEILAGFFDPTT